MAEVCVICENTSYFTSNPIVVPCKCAVHTGCLLKKLALDISNSKRCKRCQDDYQGITVTELEGNIVRTVYASDDRNAQIEVNHRIDFNIQTGHLISQRLKTEEVTDEYIYYTVPSTAQEEVNDTRASSATEGNPNQALGELGTRASSVNGGNNPENKSGSVGSQQPIRNQPKTLAEAYEQEMIDAEIDRKLRDEARAERDLAYEKWIEEHRANGGEADNGQQ